MTWRPRTDEERYPPGFRESMDRDGGLYNAWWQRGGNQLREFIEKDHFYRAKFAKPPEWLHPLEPTEMDLKHARLQRAKQKNWTTKVKRRSMRGRSEPGRMPAGMCSVLSDEEEDDGGMSRKKKDVKWGVNGWIGPNDGSPRRTVGYMGSAKEDGGSSVSSSGLASSSKKGEVLSTLSSAEASERSARIASTVDAANTRLANKSKGTKGKFENSLFGNSFPKLIN